MLAPQQVWLVVEPVDMGKGDLFATDRPLLGRFLPVATGSSRPHAPTTPSSHPALAALAQSQPRPRRIAG